MDNLMLRLKLASNNLDLKYTVSFQVEISVPLRVNL